MKLPESGDLKKATKTKIEGDIGRVNSLVKLSGGRVGIAAEYGIYEYELESSEVRTVAEIYDEQSGYMGWGQKKLSCNNLVLLPYFETGIFEMGLFSSGEKAYVVDFKRNHVYHYISADEKIKKISVVDGDRIEVDTGVRKGTYDFVVF